MAICLITQLTLIRDVSVRNEERTFRKRARGSQNLRLPLFFCSLFTSKNEMPIKRDVFISIRRFVRKNEENANHSMENIQWKFSLGVSFEYFHENKFETLIWTLNFFITGNVSFFAMKCLLWASLFSVHLDSWKR